MVSDSFAAEVEASELEARRSAVETLKPLWDLRQAIKAYESAMKAFDPSVSEYGKMGALRRWLLEHEGERLVDEEVGLVGFLQGAGEALVYDTPLAIKERAPALWERLWELGCVEIDWKRLQECIGGGLIEAADVEPFRHRRVRTALLRIEKLAE